MPIKRGTQAWKEWPRSLTRHAEGTNQPSAAGYTRSGTAFECRTNINKTVHFDKSIGMTPPTATLQPTSRAGYSITRKWNWAICWTYLGKKKILNAVPSSPTIKKEAEKLPKVKITLLTDKHEAPLGHGFTSISNLPWFIRVIAHYIVCLTQDYLLLAKQSSLREWKLVALSCLRVEVQTERVNSSRRVVAITVFAHLTHSFLEAIRVDEYFFLNKERKKRTLDRARLWRKLAYRVW